jgi:hypothetical protein
VINIGLLLDLDRRALFVYQDSKVEAPKLWFTAFTDLPLHSSFFPAVWFASPTQTVVLARIQADCPSDVENASSARSVREAPTA